MLLATNYVVTRDIFVFMGTSEKNHRPGMVIPFVIPLTLRDVGKNCWVLLASSLRFRQTLSHKKQMEIDTRGHLASSGLHPQTVCALGKNKEYRIKKQKTS